MFLSVFALFSHQGLTAGNPTNLRGIFVAAEWISNVKGGIQSMVDLLSNFPDKQKRQRQKQNKGEPYIMKGIFSVWHWNTLDKNYNYHQTMWRSDFISTDRRMQLICIKYGHSYWRGWLRHNTMSRTFLILECHTMTIPTDFTIHES